MALPKELEPNNVLEEMGDGCYPPERLIKAGMVSGLNHVLKSSELQAQLPGLHADIMEDRDELIGKIPPRPLPHICNPLICDCETRA